MESKCYDPYEDFDCITKAERYMVNGKCGVYDDAEELSKRLNSKLSESVDQVRDSSDYSIYTGYCGIALYYLREFKITGNRESYQIARNLTFRALANLKGKGVSFLTGDAGPLALAAICYLQENERYEADQTVQKLIKLSKTASDSTPDEILYGWAGYLYALHFVNNYRSCSLIPDSELTLIVQKIISDGRRLAAKDQVVFPPLMWEWHGKNYFGAAHGVAGILYMLLKHINLIGGSDKDELLKPTLEWLITRRYDSGNFMSSEGSKADRLVQWCHGAPGFTALFILASEVFDDSKYLAIALETGDVTWNYGLLKKGYSLCHGVSGNAYAFLQLFKKTHEHKHLYRAAVFRSYCLKYPKFESVPPDRPNSLFEGAAGLLYFLKDMDNPFFASFPGFE